MLVEIKIDENLKEPKIIICTNKMTEDVENIVNKLKDYNPQKIFGTKGTENFVLNQNDIESFFAEDAKVYSRKDNEKYRVRKKVYELEEMLEGTAFVRISNSEIANFDKVESLEVNGSKEICLKFKSGNFTYVSRRNIGKIKKYLGL